MHNLDTIQEGDEVLVYRGRRTFTAKVERTTKHHVVLDSYKYRKIDGHAINGSQYFLNCIERV